MTLIVLGIATALLAMGTIFQIARAIYRAHGAQQTVDAPAHNSGESEVKPSPEEAQRGGADTSDRRTRSADNPDYIKPSERIQIAVNSLLFLVIFWQLIAISIQAYIYSQQREVMRRQWIAMRRGLRYNRQSITVAQDNTVYSQRAYISVTPEPLSEVHFKLRIENSGNTPAYGVEIFATVDIVSGTQSVPFGRGEGAEHDPLGIIGPRGFYTKVYGVKHQVDMAAMRWEQANLCCWGVVKYHDIFDQGGRNTWFCFYKPPNDKNAYPHAEGNNAN